MDEGNSDNIDARLEELLEAAWDMRTQCLHKSAQRISAEARRLARAEKKLVPYLRANFHLMNVTQNTFEPESGKEAAIENIALLESPERARAFQSDYNEAEYEHTVQWMSACSYDNLAVATAEMQGYNSEGMQAVIADGIQICRQTGKLECIACFREYATGVHRAADDLEMGLHHAHQNVTRPPTKSFDRRWAGAWDEAELLLLAGRLEEARQAVNRALELVGEYHSPIYASIKTRAVARTILLLQGKCEEAAKLDPREQADAALTPPPRGEDLAHDLRCDLCDALELTLKGQHEAAMEKLAHWDRLLSQRKCLHSWLEVRLRLAAAHRVAGMTAKAEALEKQLEGKAREAGDFLTLRRLKALREEATAFPFSQAAARAAEQSARSAAAAAHEPGPLRPRIDAFWHKLEQAGGEANLEELAGELLTFDPAQATNADDAGRLLHLASLFAETPAGNERFWAWVQAVAAPHMNTGWVLACFAMVADILRNRENSPLAQIIPVANLETMFRRAMDLDPDKPGVFARAGTFFLNQGNVGEAERCLARSFRLDRSNEFVALRLATLYSHTDRISDALTALDLCLREGTVTPNLLWEAAMRSVALGRQELTLTYLNRLEKLAPGRPWAPYYRALALLDLKRPEEALAAIEEEGRRVEGPIFHIIAVKAAANAALGKLDAMREGIELLLAIPLKMVTNITHSGMGALFERLYRAGRAAGVDGPQLSTLVERALCAGLAPTDWFEELREKQEKQSEVFEFGVLLRQPLDGKWAESTGCLSGQEQWTSFIVRYGVLAKDEEEARERALAMHARCHPGAEVIACERESGPYNDRPGVVGQSYFVEPSAE